MMLLILACLLLIQADCGIMPKSVNSLPDQNPTLDLSDLSLKDEKEA